MLKLPNDSTYSVLLAAEAELGRPRGLCEDDRTITVPTQGWLLQKAVLSVGCFLWAKEETQSNASSCRLPKTLNFIAARPKVIGNGSSGRAYLVTYPPGRGLLKSSSCLRYLAAKLSALDALSLVGFDSRPSPFADSAGCKDLLHRGPVGLDPSAIVTAIAVRRNADLSKLKT